MSAISGRSHLVPVPTDWGRCLSAVDFAERTATIQHTRVVVDGRVIEQDDTKTEAGLRTIDLSDAAVAALLTWQLLQSEERENAAEAWIGDDHVLRWKMAGRFTLLSDTAVRQASRAGRVAEDHSARFTALLCLAACGCRNPDCGGVQDARPQLEFDHRRPFHAHVPVHREGCCEQRRKPDSSHIAITRGSGSRCERLVTLL